MLCEIAARCGQLRSTRLCFCRTTCTRFGRYHPATPNIRSGGGWIKKEFTKAWLATSVGQAPSENQTARHSRQAEPDLQPFVGQGPPDDRDLAVSASRQRERRRGVWQPRYWEHTIRDENDFERHFDYIHWNPVKHGCVRCPHEWPHSSFHQYVERGVYDRRWGCFSEAPPAAFHFHDIRSTTGE
jgi:hypothetical protein